MRDSKMTDVILLFKAMKTTANGAKMKNTNCKTPDKPVCFNRNSLLVLEWE